MDEEKRGMRYALWLALALCLGAFLQHVLNAVPWDGQNWLGRPLSSWQTPVYTGIFCAGAWAISVGIGAIFWLLLLPIVGASWAQPLTRTWRRLMTSSFGGGWLLLFLCFPALPLLYTWARSGADVTGFWHNSQMWVVRMGVICSLSVALGMIAYRVSIEGFGKGFGKTSRAVGAIGLLVFIPALAVLGIDLWVMPQPAGAHFSMTPLIFIATACISALCLAVWFPLIRNARLRRSLMGLLLMALSFKAYFSFSQYMIVQYGGIPAETAFYALRKQAMGEMLFYSLAVFNLILPLLVAIVPFFRRNIVGVRVISAVCLLTTLPEFYVYIAPAVPGNGFTMASVLFYAVSVVIVCTLGVLIPVDRKKSTENS